METKLEVISSVEALEAINRTEVDIAISTAKTYPRDIVKAKEEIYKLATSSMETAEAGFYHLERKDKNGKIIDITGPSIRLAEIVVYSMGNINSGFRVIANDGKKIIAQAVAHDLERNNRVLVEVSRNILTIKGYTFSEDMQIVTGNAAGAIAWRNANFKIIPNAVWIDIQDRIKKFIVGDGKDFKKRRDSALKKFENLGVTTEQILKKLNLATVDAINDDILIKLLGLLVAINEGTSSVEESFGVAPPKTDSEDLQDDAPEETKNGELPLNK